MIRKTRWFGDTEFIQHQERVKILQLKINHNAFYSSCISKQTQLVSKRFIRNTKVIKSAMKTHLSPSNTPADSSPDAFRLFYAQNDLRNFSDHHKHLGIYLKSHYFASALSLWAPKCTGSHKRKMHIYLDTTRHFNVIRSQIICFHLWQVFGLYVDVFPTASYTDDNPCRFKLFKGAVPVTMTCNILSHKECQCIYKWLAD